MNHLSSLRLATFAIPLLCAYLSLADTPNPSPDSAELASGLTLQGHLAARTITLETSLGRFDIPADDIRTLISPALSRSSHILSTHHGDRLIGRLTSGPIPFTATDGTIINLNPAQLTRLERSLAKPAPTTAPTTRPTATVHTLDGGELHIAPPDSLAFQTHFGPLSFRADQLEEIIVNAPSQPGHRALLTDGSTLSGFLIAGPLSVRPIHAPPIKVPIGALREIEFPSPPAATRADTARLDLVGGDTLRGPITGAITLETELGPRAIPADTIDRITPREGYPGEFAVSLSTGHSLAGPPPAGARLTCHLACGLDVSVPTSSLLAYARSSPAHFFLRATPDQSLGLNAPSSGDGEYALADHDAIRCWSVPPDHYLYLSVSDAARPWPANTPADLEVEYLDSAGPPSDFHLEYDSPDATQPLNGAYKGHPNLVRLAATNQWRTERFHIPDPRFAGSQNLHADLRLHHGGITPLLIRAVRLQPAAAR